jgi:multimeric flavodoxin WrbA
LLLLRRRVMPMARPGREGGVMSTVIAINGSPRMDRGDTEMVLASFLQGMADAGASVETIYASRLGVKPCDCGHMRCWYKHPGRCHHKDDMSDLCVRLQSVDILVLATPVYIPLPGAMQDVINRLCPLIDPVLETRAGRTRARLREDVRIRQIALVATGGWWEKENFDTVVRIVEEFCETAGVEFAGAVLRPHADVMRPQGALTEDGEEILRMTALAGSELVRDGVIQPDILEAVSRPLISREALLDMYNGLARA